MLRMCGAISMLPHTPSRRGAELSTGTALPFTFYTFREGGSLALIRFGSGSERKGTGGPRLSLPRTTSLRFKDVFARGIFSGHTLGHFKINYCGTVCSVLGCFDSRCDFQDRNSNMQ